MFFTPVFPPFSLELPPSCFLKQPRDVPVSGLVLLLAYGDLVTCVLELLEQMSKGHLGSTRSDLFSSKDLTLQ